MAGDDDAALGLARGLPDGYHVVRGALFGERVKGLFIEKELGDNKEKGDNDKGYAYAEQGVCGCGKEVGEEQHNCRCGDAEYGQLDPAHERSRVK